MKIFYTLHALERMRRRGISRELVKQCLQEPDKDEEYGEVCRCIKKINNKVLIVFYKRKDGDVMVITTYVSSKVYKYLP